MAAVELITGPAGSGKSARVREAYRAELAARQAEGRFGTALWITPTQRSRRHVLRTVLAGGPGVCFAPQVVTFDEFAEALLRTAPEAVRPLSKVAKRKLIRDLIDDLNRRRKLKYFGAVAETAGFLELCVSFISELKREEVWPEDFEKACRELGGDDPTPGRKRGSPKDRELSLIYDAYQRRLHAAGGEKPRRESAAGLYDGEGRFWSARTLMRGGHRGPFRELTLVAVDGFTDFTRTQYEMLAELAGWTDRTLVTLPLDSTGRRDDLFAKSAAASDELRTAFGGRHDLVERPLGLSSDFERTAFGQVSAELFSNPREVRRRDAAAGLTILSCARRVGEIEEIARRVKRLLVAGTPADEIVVAFRSLDGLADLVRESFAAAGVPAAVETGPAIVRTGAVRLLLALLDLERENWAFPKLVGVLNSTLFRPDWPGVADGTAARAAAAVLRAFNIDGGREVTLTALARRAERLDGDAEPVLRLALETLRQLSDELAPFRHRATFAEWVDRLLHAAAALRIAPEDGERIAGDDGSVAAAEAGGWLAFVRLVEEAKKAETLAGGPARSIGLVEFRKQLDELLAGQTWEAEEPEDGRVRVLAAEQVRNLDVPHLFLCGLSESSFPQSRGDDCLYGDAERLRLSEGGLPIGHRTRRSREEMLLFYGVVTRARRSLTLSFPSVDEGGEPLYPSPYLTAIRDLFTAEALPVESCGRLEPIPGSAAECVTECEFRVFAARELIDGRGAGLFAAVADRRESEEAARNVAAAAEMAAARFATRGLTNYEGLLSDPKNLKRLRQRFGGRHEFSASELETYAAHPFRYFLLYVLGLEPPADPGPATDFARRGSVLHAALAATHRRLAEAVAETAAADALDELLRGEVEHAHRAGGDTPLQRALQRIEREILAKRAGRYPPQWEKYHESFQGLWDGPPRPTHFEVAFGNAPDEEGGEREVRHPVVEFGTNGERVRVRGRIDRIDLGTAEGRAVFNVIDYKLGQPPRFGDGDVANGRALQLALYAAAARRLGIVDAELYQLAFWSLNGDGFVCGMKGGRKGVRPLEAEVAAALEESLDLVVPRLADSIRAGRFPVVADDPDETYNGDYAAVARVGSFRSVAEVLEKRLPEEASANPKGRVEACPT